VPWHGSQFNVHSGKAVTGPAKDDIELFDAQVRDGQVYVRPKQQREKRAA
jgi:nitrite reductase/ring-hydroxylating ferredoxin subunit